MIGRTTRQKIHNKYFAYKKGSYSAPVSVVSSLVNGLTGILAVLYGEGGLCEDGRDRRLGRIRL